MSNLEDEREGVEFRVKKLGRPVGVKSKVLIYADYLKRKAELLPDHYSYKYAKGLDWLYDPDSHSDNLFTKPDWEIDYSFVVLLQGDDERMSGIASEILLNERRVGLVCFFKHK